MDRNAMTDQSPSDPSVNDDQNSGIVTRRRALMMGAITASAVVSIKPALAQTAGSVLNCEIPVPGNNAVGGFIAADGSVCQPTRQAPFRRQAAILLENRCVRR